MKKLFITILLISTVQIFCFGQDTLSVTDISVESFKKGIDSYNQKDYQTAENYLTDYVKDESEATRKAFGYYWLALVQFQIQRPAKALEFIDKALQLHNSYYYHFYRGRFNYQNQNARKAIKDYDVAIQLIPNFGNAYAWRGIAKYWIAKVPQACQDFDRGVELGSMEAKAMKEKLCK